MQIGEALQRATSPLQRAHSPGVRSNTSYTYLDSESRMEAAGLNFDDRPVTGKCFRWCKKNSPSRHLKFVKSRAITSKLLKMPKSCQFLEVVDPRELRPDKSPRWAKRQSQMEIHGKYNSYFEKIFSRDKFVSEMFLLSVRSCLPAAVIILFFFKF